MGGEIPQFIEVPEKSEDMDPLETVWSDPEYGHIPPDLVNGAPEDCSIPFRKATPNTVIYWIDPSKNWSEEQEQWRLATLSGDRNSLDPDEAEAIPVFCDLRAKDAWIRHLQRLY